MRITINSIIGKTVQYSICSGVAFAKWIGPLPRPDSVQIVELEVCDDLVWGVNALSARDSSCSLYGQREKTTFVAKVNEVEGFHVTASLFGEVFYLWVEGIPSDYNGSIKFTAFNVLLYPVNC